MPFDQFAIEQLAGDLLPAATRDQKIATGFHRNTQINEEGGIDPEQFRVEAVVDRVSTTGTAFLGLTVGCAQCHDHKFDPISQREYYQLFAFFNTTGTTATARPTPAARSSFPARCRRPRPSGASSTRRAATWIATSTPTRPPPSCGLPPSMGPRGSNSARPRATPSAAPSTS